MSKKSSRELLENASQMYYEGTPIMSDDEYDNLFDEHKKKYPDDIILGYKPKRERNLSIPMYSLDKVSSVSEVSKWLKLKIGGRDNIELILLPKYDGISLTIDESSSPELRRATTRGTGTVGQECDSHYSLMNNGDVSDNYPMHSFGEAIMPKKQFYKYDKANGGKYKNPRNLVGSNINADKLATSVLRDTDYIRYGLVCTDGSLSFTTKAESIDFLNTINVVKVPYLVIENGSLTHEIIMECYHKWSQDHELDGIVVEINRLGLQKSLGRERSGNPAYSRKYKGHFENVEITCVEKVSWQVSKHGKLKPVVNIEPVRLSGADVSNVTGYNARNIIENKIGSGAIVSVKRSGAVIPKIVEVNNPSEEEELVPSKCPSCGCATGMDDNNVDLMCFNDACPEMNISRISSFFEILNCKEVGRGTIEALYNAGFKSVNMILRASEIAMNSLPKHGEKKAAKIYKEIHSCVDGVKMSTLMHASGCFKDIGSSTIQLILDGESVGSHDTSEYNKGIDDFNQFYNYIKDLVKISGKDTQKTSLLSGVQVVFTGFRDASLEKVIQENGGKVGNSVTAKTTHLVMAVIGSGTKKEMDAEKHGTAVMVANEFRDYINNILDNG